MNSAIHAPSHWRRHRKLYLLLAVALTPVLASYFFVYVMPPSSRVNYGALLDPRPLQAMPLHGRTLGGEPFDFRRLSGKWTMVMADGGACPQACVEKLFQMRQQHAMTGRDSDRVARLWLITDDERVPEIVVHAYEGTAFVRVNRFEAERALPLPDEAQAQTQTQVSEFIWLMDPMGNVMLRWPAQPDAGGVKRDLSRLLRASAHWVRIEQPR